MSVCVACALPAPPRQLTRAADPLTGLARLTFLLSMDEEVEQASSCNQAYMYALEESCSRVLEAAGALCNATQVTQWMEGH